MGYTLQLQLVEKIDNPATHQFKVQSPDGKWDYVDLNDELDLYAISDYDSMAFYESLIAKGRWKKEVIDFLKKTDARFYSDAEGYEPTIYSPDEIMEFVNLLENEINKQNVNQATIYKHLQPNKKGRVPLKEEIDEIKDRIDIARTNGYYFKCLDR